jgi:hypothetical protein
MRQSDCQSALKLAPMTGAQICKPIDSFRRLSVWIATMMRPI